MPVFNAELTIQTQGCGDIVDITDGVVQAAATSGIAEGLINLFVAHSTAALTTLEYEPGCVKDLQELVERLIPSSADYNHNRLAGDSNANAHLSSALIGPSESIPLSDRRVILGTWQQVVLVDFDDRPRSRRVSIQIMS